MGDSGESRQWTVVRRDTVFAGGPVREVAVERVALPDGREIADYYQLRMDDFVLVFATTEAGVIVLRQYKHGVRRVCLTFPGGAINHDETPLEAAQRELFEETGYASDSWTEYGSFVTHANQLCNRAHFFRASHCRRVSEPGAPDLEEPEILILPEAQLRGRDVLQQFGLASHVALLAIATHPDLGLDADSGGVNAQQNKRPVSISEAGLSQE
jgi:ADP-ribose pyrophosphatase